VSDSSQILLRNLLRTGVACALVGGASLAHAQSAAPSTAPKIPADDGSLTYKGITLYGIVDIGLQYQTHGAAISDYYPGGSTETIQKYGNHSVFGVTPNNMAQSRVGLSGVESLGFGDLSGVFRIETYFNPNSGQLSDGARSVTANNGRAIGAQTSNADSSVSGQPFEQAYLGISSKMYGTLTFGRQNTVLADLISKYDPNYASQAFSLIGVSGTTAGGGDTQNRRLDNSAKYVANFAGLVHAAVQYKFNQSTGGGNNAYEFDVGAEYAGASVDAVYAHVNGALNAGPMSAAQVALLPGLGISVDKGLSVTESDNSSLSLAGLYNLGVWKFFAGAEYIQYSNPQHVVPVGYDDNGYKVAFVNSSAFPHAKQFQVYWAGARYSASPALDLTVAYYGYHQNSYGAGASSGCTTNAFGTCSGSEHVFSFNADYKFSKRFDGYAGLMYSTVEDGLANGFTFARNDMNPTVGVRYKF
jgi:predicted porin